MTVFQQPASPRVPTIGIFAPVIASSDALTSERAQQQCTLIAKTFTAIKLPGLAGAQAEVPGIVIASRVVVTQADAAAVSAEFAAAGVAVLIIVGGAWQLSRSTALAVTANFPNAHLACVAGSVTSYGGVAALSGAYAQSGRLCAVVYGLLTDASFSADFTPASKSEIVDLGWAMTAAKWLSGKTIALAEHDADGDVIAAANDLFGIKFSTQVPASGAALLRKSAVADAKELKRLAAWVIDDQWAGRIHADGATIAAGKIPLLTNPKPARTKPLSAAARRTLEQELARYLAMRNYLRETAAIGGAWADVGFGEALFASAVDHAGAKCAHPVAAHGDALGMLTMVAFAALTGGEALMTVDTLVAYEPARLQKKADDLGVRIELSSGELAHGVLHCSSSGTGALGWAQASHLAAAAGKQWTQGAIVPPGISALAGRLGYSELTGMFTLVHGEVDTVGLPAPLSEALAHSATYLAPHLWLRTHGSPTRVSNSLPGSALHLVRHLPVRRWQYFSDYTAVQNARWSAPSAHDRVEPLVYRLAGGENLAKDLLGQRGGPET